MSKSSKGDEVYVATKTAHIAIGDRRVKLVKDVTRVRAGHELLDTHPGLFKPVGEGVRFDIEDAVSRPISPSSRRTAGPTPPEPVKPYSEWTKTALRKEISKRNKDRDADAKITADLKKDDVDKLAEALAADDTPTPVETGGTDDGTTVSNQSPDGEDPADHTGDDPAAEDDESGKGDGTDA